MRSRAAAHVDGGYFNILVLTIHKFLIALSWRCCPASSARTAKLFWGTKAEIEVLLPGFCITVEVCAEMACVAEIVVLLLRFWVLKVSQCAVLRRCLAADAAFRIWAIWAFEGSLLSFFGRTRNSRESAG